MTTLCALGFIGSLLYSIVKCRKGDRVADSGIDWRIVLPMVVGGIGGALAVTGNNPLGFLISYPISIALWFFLFMAFCLE